MRVRAGSACATSPTGRAGVTCTTWPKARRVAGVGRTRRATASLAPTGDEQRRADISSQRTRRFPASRRSGFGDRCTGETRDGCAAGWAFPIIAAGTLMVVAQRMMSANVTFDRPTLATMALCVGSSASGWDRVSHMRWPTIAAPSALATNLTPNTFSSSLASDSSRRRSSPRPRGRARSCHTLASQREGVGQPFGSCWPVVNDRRDVAPMDTPARQPGHSASHERRWAPRVGRGPTRTTRRRNRIPSGVGRSSPRVHLAFPTVTVQTARAWRGYHESAGRSPTAGVSSLIVHASS